MISLYYLKRCLFFFLPDYDNRPQSRTSFSLFWLKREFLLSVSCPCRFLLYFRRAELLEIFLQLIKVMKGPIRDSIESLVFNFLVAL